MAQISWFPPISPRKTYINIFQTLHAIAMRFSPQKNKTFFVFFVIEFSPWQTLSVAFFKYKLVQCGTLLCALSCWGFNGLEHFAAVYSCTFTLTYDTHTITQGFA